MSLFSVFEFFWVAGDQFLENRNLGHNCSFPHVRDLSLIAPAHSIGVYDCIVGYHLIRMHNRLWGDSAVLIHPC